MSNDGLNDFWFFFLKSSEVNFYVIKVESTF